MKSHTKLFAVIVLLLSFAAAVKAENPVEFSHSDVENLITGINSENNGLMRSSVYFAGKYKIEETSEALVERLETEKNPSNIVLIALAIYQIGDDEAVMKIIDTAKNADEGKVKRMLTAIAMQYLNETDTKYVLQ